MLRSYLQQTGLTPKLLTVLRQGYGLVEFKSDAVAGLTVAIVAVPLAMALAIASGASPDKGLLTVVVAGFLVSLLGGSRVQIGGPTGAFVVVLFNVIAQHGYDGLILATLLAGAMLVIAGAANLGQIIKFIPHPVVTGFTAGIAVIIASSQVKDFLGLRIDEVPAEFVPTWVTYIAALDTIHLATAIIGFLSLAVIIVLKRLAPRVPSYLIAVAVAGAATWLFELRLDTIGSRFPDILVGIPAPMMPELSFARIQEVLPSALTIAFLAGIEALLSAVVADTLTGYRHRSNQELVGQGIANMASALFGGLPATGAIARTATNIRAGGKSPVAGLLHAVFALAFMMFAWNLTNLIPMAALAAILFVVSFGMSEYQKFIHLIRMPSDDRAVLLITFGLTLLVDLTVAIAVGVVLASMMFMARMMKTVEIDAGRAGMGGTTTNGAPNEEDQRINLPPGVEAFRIAGPLFFGVASELLDTLGRIGQRPRVLVVRLRLVPFLDSTGAQALRDLVAQCEDMNIKVIFSGAQPQLLKMLAAIDLGHESARVRHAPSFETALQTAREIA